MDLLVPVIDTQRVSAVFDGQASYANLEARQVQRENWQRLETVILPVADAAPTWLHGGSRTNLADLKERHSCCVGEDVGVDIDMRNPLRIDLAVTRLRLVCTFEPAVAAASHAPAARAATRVEPAPFQVREERITLHGDERAVVHLRVRPLRPGTLEVQGVAWVLNGAAEGQRAFEIPQPRPRKAGSTMILLDAEREAPGGLTFTVLPPMPRLEVDLEGLPPSLLDGQLLRCTMRIKNSGAMTLQHLSLACGSADMFLGESTQAADCGPSDEQPASGAADGTEHKGEGDCPEITWSLRQGVPVFTLHPSTKLGVNQELRLPFWVRYGSPVGLIF